MHATRTAKVQLRADGIVEVSIQPAIAQTKADAEENLAAARKTARGTVRPLLVDIEKAVGLTPEVRNHYATQNLADTFSKFALVVAAGPWGVAMGNIYFAVAKHSIPIRLFTQKDDAVAWLSSQD